MPLPLLPLAIGGGLGLLGGGLLASKSGGKGNFLTGTPAQTKQFQRFTPQQQQLQQQSINQLMSLLGPMAKQRFDFAPIAQQARTQFQQQTIPSIAERFTAMGGGALSSPAFASQLGQAGAGLEESLAALQSQYGFKEQALRQNLLQTLLALGMQPAFETAYQPASPGFAQQFASGLGSAAGLLPLSFL